MMMMMNQNRHLLGLSRAMLQKCKHDKTMISRPCSSSAAHVEMSTEAAQQQQWPRKIFSGIQPTGSLHLGNYMGAIRKWQHMQNSQDDSIYCIVDLHSITSFQDPHILRENILQMYASILACGMKSERCTIFVQSDVKEHSELCWILSCLSTMARLGHLPQYKEKSRLLKDIPLGLFAYPVLQAADIMLYKATHVPVGEDQLQHIQLAQHLAKIFNFKYGDTFPICHAVVDENENSNSSRVRSLREPTKKMSKSDANAKSVIYLSDEPDAVLEKIKKAITDFTSEVTYDPEARPGVSNLISLHAHATGCSVEQIVADAVGLDTGKYKLRVAEALIEFLNPIRLEMQRLLEQRAELQHLLNLGADKAREQAAATMSEVKQKVGLGSLVDVGRVETVLKTVKSKN